MDRPPNRLFLAFGWRDGQQPFVNRPIAPGEEAIGGEVNGGPDDAVASVVSNDEEVEEEPEYPFDIWTVDLYGPNGDEPTPECDLITWQLEGRVLLGVLNDENRHGGQWNRDYLRQSIMRYAHAEVDFARSGGTFPDEDSRREFYAMFDAQELEILIAERVRYGGPDFEPDDIEALNAERLVRH
jgi:hypothetical protein